MDISMPPNFPTTDFRAFGIADQRFFPKLLSDEDSPKIELKTIRRLAKWCRTGASIAAVWKQLEKSVC